MQVLVISRLLMGVGGVVEPMEVDRLISFFLNVRNGTVRIFW